MASAPGEKETIEDQVVNLDYGEFINKRVLRCKLVYKGGRPPTLIDSEFVACEFIFEGDALNTLMFLRGIAGDKRSTSGKDLVLRQMLGIEP